MAITNALNPLVVITALDDVFFQEYNYPVGPGMATAETPAVFKQDTMDNAAHIEAVSSGAGGFWMTKAEEEDVRFASPRVDNKVSYFAVTYAKALKVSKEYFDDNEHGTYAMTVKRFAANARATRDLNAFALYRNAFTTTLTADGVSWINSLHQTIDGATVSNRVSGNPVLAPTSLKAAIVQLLQVKSQDGITMAEQPATLVVPSALYPLAMEVTGSALVSDTANNTLNVFSSIYQIAVYQSPFMGASNGGSDTAWFLLSRNHAATRYVREEINTDIIDYRITLTDNYYYQGRYRDTVGVTDYIGAIGSSGDGSAS